MDSGAWFDLLRLERCRDLLSIVGREMFPRVVCDVHCHIDGRYERNKRDVDFYALGRVGQ